jgi:hypothetical protein
MNGTDGGLVDLISPFPQGFFRQRRKVRMVGEAIEYFFFQLPGGFFGEGEGLQNGGGYPWIKDKNIDPPKDGSFPNPHWPSPRHPGPPNGPLFHNPPDYF